MKLNYVVKYQYNVKSALLRGGYRWGENTPEGCILNQTGRYKIDNYFTTIVFFGAVGNTVSTLFYLGAFKKPYVPVDNDYINSKQDNTYYAYPKIY